MNEFDETDFRSDFRSDAFPGQGGEGRLSAEWLEELRQRLADNDVSQVHALCADLRAVDTGDVLEALDSSERLSLVRLLGDHFDYSALAEVDESVRVKLIDVLPNIDIAHGVSKIHNDDAVFILEDIKAADREAILAEMPAFERISLKRSLDFPEDSAGRRMQTEFIAIPPFWTVGQTIDYMRVDDELPQEFYQIYVVDPSYNVFGVLSLDKMLRAKRPVKVEDIMSTDVFFVDASEDQEEAARVFQRYDLVEIAVVDESHRLVGVLTVDDIVDVINEEADEDIRALAGIGDEEISNNVFEAVKSRSTWLLVNLVTAVVASMVIRLFDGTIEQMVALAVLMPIVASMGGNAGTQTMTVTVRALSTKELDQFNVRRLISREALVGLVNGLIFAVITGVVTAVWFGSLALGGVIAVAMLVNMIAAGIFGILIPLGLEKAHIDPAVASTAFVTTVTDVVGFFAFLGLAAWWLQLT